ncbi:MAG: glutamate 5-kinase [Deltaproteobacteria bacterium]|nr:glutamate 5-kinase [Deltaproteobacteria bacterium]
MRKRIVKKAKRVVVKVGSSVVVGNGEDSSGGFFSRIAQDVHLAKKDRREILIVSSGSIAMGRKKLGLKERPATIPERQAIAAVGQVDLMARYDDAFSRFGEKVAQMLLTHDDFADRRRFLNARNTTTTLLNSGIIPIVNENDTVSVEELKFGDNDNLSALMTNLMEAELLIMLSDIDGLYDRDPKADPKAQRVALVEDADSLSLDTSAAKTNLYGTGGMASKIEAAKKAAHFGCATIVADGTMENVLQRIFDGEDVGTLILPKEDRLTSKKHWIAYSTRPSGRVFVDDGAKTALLKKGRSLLPSGIVKVEGSFEAGEVIHCVDTGGMEFARGVVNYSSSEIDRIKGLNTKEIENALGYRVYDEVIHRDNLVVL